MLERGISRQDVSDVVSSGTIIEFYKEDRVIPTYLILGSTKTTQLHVVIGYDATIDTAYVVTTYSPDAAHFENDMSTRKRS